MMPATQQENYTPLNDHTDNCTNNDAQLCLEERIQMRNCSWLSTIKTGSLILLHKQGTLRCRETLPANDKAIAQILMEVPALPSPSVGHFLSEVADLGGDWATLALSSARDIIINRPPNRWVGSPTCIQV